MNVATKRTLIATAAIAAAGLFGSLPYQGSLVADSGVPTVHHDVALVDVASDAASTTDYSQLGAAETIYDDSLGTNFVSQTGLEESLYTSLAPNSDAFLDTGGTGGVYAENFGAIESPFQYLNDFNGAFTSLYDGYLADAVAFEDGLNNLVGGESTLMPMLQATFTTNYVPPVAGIGDINPADATTMAGFQTDLTTLANADFTAASNDFSGYLTYLGDNYTSLTSAGFSLTGILTDLSSGLESSATTLSTDFTAILTSLSSLF